MKKTILITGSTDGIGKLAAKKLAQSGHHIILHGRNSEKIEKVEAEIKSASGNENVYGYVADFSKLEEVTKMASRIANDLPHIDILVNNAGVFKASNTIAGNGMDLRLVVNYLAPFVLTNALLPMLMNGKGRRVINLSSAAQTSVPRSTFDKGINLSDNEAYARSKLAILQWSFFMAEQHSEITTIALNPGSLLDTKMVKEAYGKFWAPADKGADIIVDLATNSKYVNSSGKYFDNDRGSFGEAHPDAYDDQIIEELISITNKIVSN